MSNERLTMEGALAKKRERLEKAKISAEGYLIALRAELKSYEEIEDLNLDRAKGFFDDLYSRYREIQALKEEIAKLEGELYG
jgi:hypothetical protein